MEIDEALMTARGHGLYETGNKATEVLVRVVNDDLPTAVEALKTELAQARNRISHLEAALVMVDDLQQHARSAASAGNPGGNAETLSKIHRVVKSALAGAAVSR